MKLFPVVPREGRNDADRRLPVLSLESRGRRELTAPRPRESSVPANSPTVIKGFCKCAGKHPSVGAAALRGHRRHGGASPHRGRPATAKPPRPKANASPGSAGGLSPLLRAGGRYRPGASRGPASRGPASRPPPQAREPAQGPGRRRAPLEPARRPWRRRSRG